MSADRSANTLGQSALLQPSSTVIVLVLNKTKILVCACEPIVLRKATNQFFKETLQTDKKTRGNKRCWKIFIIKTLKKLKKI